MFALRVVEHLDVVEDILSRVISSFVSSGITVMWWTALANGIRDYGATSLN
jgi:phage tail sheath protein FI